MLRAALALVHRGCAIFPCRPCSKQPATEHGFLDATKDTSVVEAWWQDNPAYNVAIATGHTSGFFALDVDGLDAEIELRKLEAEHGVLPPSIEVITASGRHIYFRMPPEVDLRCSAGQLASGLDCRAAGGYVVAPPSVHPSGRRYAWSVDCASAIAAAPDWLVAKLSSSSNGNGTRPVPPAEWRTLAANGVAEGARDTSVTRLAGYLLRRHADPFLVLELLQAWNAQRCTPPLPAADIGRIVELIAGRELRRRASDDG